MWGHDDKHGYKKETGMGLVGGVISWALSEAISAPAEAKGEYDRGLAIGPRCKRGTPVTLRRARF